jgi:hypothetical protein
LPSDECLVLIKEIRIVQVFAVNRDAAIGEKSQPVGDAPVTGCLGHVWGANGSFAFIPGVRKTTLAHTGYQISGVTLIV